MALRYFSAKHPTSVRCLAYILGLMLLIVSVGRGQTNNEIVYVYDELGRVVAVIDVAGEAAVYRYDAVGNLLTISRYSSAVVSLIEFTPKRGVVGTGVTIYGTGFSTTANQNSVTFNGVAATVTSATATRIVTTVPAGATTGPIALTAPGGNASSSVSFVVGETGAPTITNFTPTIGSAGTSVTITGTNYETAPQNNKTKFNATYSSITAATATTINTSVPVNSTSGHISVSTPAGTAVSSADFFVPPSPYTPADVAVTGRMAIGESKVVTLPPNKVGLIVFDGVAGQRVSLGMSGVTINGSWDVATVTIYRPNGTFLQAPFGFGAGGNGTPTQILPVTGTYSILVDPYNANAGNVTLHLAEDIASPITINGPPVNLTFQPGRNAWLTFSGTAGQRVSVGANGVTLSGSWGRGTMSIYKPDGTTLQAPFEFDQNGNGTPSNVLPVTGTYAVFIDPYNANTGNVTVYLSEDHAPPMAINDPPVTLTFRPGQNARMTFAGTAGERVSVGASNVTLTGSWGRGTVSIYKPDGTALQAPFEFDQNGHGTPTQTLPVTGNYALQVDPYYANNGNVTVTVSSDISATITINGSPVALNLSRAGQNAWLTFDGTAGQRVSVGVSGVTLSGSWGRGTVSIYKPDGTALQTPFEFDQNGHGTPTKVLPVTGTYSILVDPYYANVGNVTVHLSEDLSPSISINDVPVTMTFRPGQNAWLTFSGTAGQRVTVGASNVTLSGSWGRGTVAIYKPDGTALQTPFEFDQNGHGTPTKILPVTGTYAIQVDPYYANYGNVTLYLSEDLSPPISFNDPPVTMTFRPGQNAWLTFSGTAGQRVSVGASNVTLSGSWGRGTVAIYNPDGTALQTPFEFDQNGHGTPTKVLPVTGTYAIQVDPYYANYGNVTVTLSADLTGTISINGSPVTLALSRAGQNAWLTFDGNAGQRVSVGVSGVTLTGSWGRGTVAIYKPDGTALQTPFEFDQNGHGTPTKVLPVTGTYTIQVDPYYANVGNVIVHLSEDLAPAISINDVPVSMTFRPGQNSWLTFAGTAGQRVSVGVSGVTLTGSWGRGTVAIYKPDGTALQSPLEFDTNGQGTPSKVLPVTGTYAVLVDPYYSYYGNVTVTLSEDLTSTLTIGGPTVTQSITRLGQNGILTFSGNSGQVVTVVVSNNGIGNTGVTLLKPDGTTLTSTTQGNPNFNLATSTLPSTGTYSVIVDPVGLAVGSITFQLYDPALNAATLKADYRFENNRDSSFSGAPTLTDLGTNSFTTATVDGVSKTVLSFTQNNGVSLSSTSGLISSTSYSIVMLFSFEQTSGWRRVVDVRNAMTDGGLYALNGKLNFYPHASGNGTISNNTYVQVVMTREPTGNVVVYLNGTLQFQFNDSSSYALINSANTIRFFRDDNNPGEASPGSVARIRVYDGILTSSQVAALDRLP